MEEMITSGIYRRLHLVRMTLPPDGNSFTMAFESFRWNKDVTIMVVYEMRVNIVALHQRAFYSREDYNKDKK